MARKSLLSRYLWLLPFLSFLSGYWLMSIWYRPKVLQAPALVGKTVYEAMRIVTDQNINLRLLEEREDADLPEGTILQQNPAASATMKPQQSIYCVVSKKSAKVIPQIVGKQLADCVKTLDELGILYKQYLIESSSPEGLCIAQDTIPGSVPSSGPLIVYGAKSIAKPVIIPSFLYSTISVVKRFLESVPVSIEVVHASVVPSDHHCDHSCIITDQRPRAGMIVTLDDKNPLHIQLFVD